MSIFLHNSIPHFHIDENQVLCHELIHNAGMDTDDADLSVRFVNMPSDIKVCHISGFLFHSFNPDNLIFHQTKEINFSSESFRSPFVIVHDRALIPENYHGSTSFRAPPAA